MHYCVCDSELKKQSLDESDFTSSTKPLAPMQTGLYPLDKQMSNDRKTNTNKPIGKPVSLLVYIQYTCTSTIHCMVYLYYERGYRLHDVLCCYHTRHLSLLVRFMKGQNKQ